ncbi:MAG: bifunctional riboflavin kinase/FAD synthetase [Actinomycetota bacterium]|nr:bifunctional riboflavin kinase/FAD synthetase [Actinomycetota bacterium]
MLRGDPREWLAPPAGSAVTIGVYDGVHRGHQEVIGRLRERAAVRGVASGLITFDRHPLRVVAPQRAPQLLTTLEQRLELLEGLGLELVAVLPFDERMRELGPEAFVSLVLDEGVDARLVLVGEDFRFGKHRAGDVDALAELGKAHGFEVEAVPLLEAGETPLSSTAIRQAVAAGRVEEAARVLGRCHEVRGEVVAGSGRGRELGFPTANLMPSPEVVVPGRGIYAGRVEVGRDEHLAAASVGVRPTFGEEERVVVEAYLLDFEGDLYGRQIDLRLCWRLRDEERFESVDELVAQMHRDVKAVREASHPPNPPPSSGGGRP